MPEGKTHTSQDIDWPDLAKLLPALLDSNASTPDGCDIETYLAKLDGLEITQEEKRELIHTLYSIIETLVGIQF